MATFLPNSNKRAATTSFVRLSLLLEMKCQDVSGVGRAMANVSLSPGRIKAQCAGSISIVTPPLAGNGSLLLMNVFLSLSLYLGACWTTDFFIFISEAAKPDSIEFHPLLATHRYLVHIFFHPD